MATPLACISGIAADRVLHERGQVREELGVQHTPYGPSQFVSVCESGHGRFLFLSRFGAAHQPTPPHAINHRANLWALRALGARHILAWNDTKAVSHNYRVGQFVLVDDLIDETVSPPLSFLDTYDAAHVRQWPVFCAELRGFAADALRAEGCEFNERGVYVCVEGHRQDTPAEVRKYATYGGDLIGRALAPEVFLAKELQLAYAAVCYVSSYAEIGSSARPFERGQVLDEDIEAKRVADAVSRLPGVMEHIVKRLDAGSAPAKTSPANQTSAGPNGVVIPNRAVSQPAAQHTARLR